MPPVTGVENRVLAKQMVVPAIAQQSILAPPSDAYAKDAMIAWFRGEFAAANAIIDALCGHLAQMEGGAAAYESMFVAIHRRRMNWIPILQMQKFYSIADVTLELSKIAGKRRCEVDSSVKSVDEAASDCFPSPVSEDNLKEKSTETTGAGDGNVGGDAPDDNSTSEIGDAGCQEVQPLKEDIDICSNHEDCEARCAKIQMKKGFVAKESVKGRVVNIVRGLKLFEGIFTPVELCKLREFVNELRVAGRNGELPGETFILFNQQTKGTKRELIQFGTPIFGKVQDDETIHKGCNEPIPPLLQGVIQHLVQWRLLPENRRPNSCIINFFDEGEHSQPFLKPPHLDQPLSTLVLYESTMAFGRVLVSDGEGNFNGPLMLSLTEGSLLVMRGNSCETARHAMSASPNKRVSITFFRVKTEMESSPSEPSYSSKAMTLWQPCVSIPYSGAEAAGVVPLVMLAPVSPLLMSPGSIPCGGTGVFLPWTMGSRRHAKHLPPRAQRGRLLALPFPVETCKSDPNSDSGK